MQKRGKKDAERDQAGKEDQGASERPLSASERIEATQWQILRDVALIAAMGGKGRSTDLSREQQDELLGPMVPTLVGAAEMLKECGRQFFLLGVGRVHRDLHAADGIDHEMLDQAVEYHTNQAVPEHADDPLILER